jgi:hypothetical protein
MARLLPKKSTRRAVAWSTALMAYDVWKRLPPAQRRQILANARKHGPRLAKGAFRHRRMFF